MDARPIRSALLLTLAAAGQVAFGATACGDDAPTGDEPIEVIPGSLLDDPSQELPQQMSAVGLYPFAPELERTPDVAVGYLPTWPLWSNGSDKERFIVLPAGAQIDNSGDAWVFPEGTLLFKTFTFWDADGNEVPGETRLMRRTADGWDYATYVWNEDGTDATLNDPRRPLEVQVFALDGTELTHTVPSKVMCRKCHESSPSEVLGFDELQLAGRDATTESQLAQFSAAGLFAAAVAAEPERIVHDDPLTLEVLGYFEGNCVHCHNGSDSAETSSYDLGWQNALANLIDQPTQSSASAPGIRVIPGNSTESILYEAVSRITDEESIAEMPPLGWDVVDPDGVALIRTWIDGLE